MDKDIYIIYPNPNEGVFNIRAENLSKETNYQILNAAGKLVRSGYIQHSSFNETQINIGYIENGIYLLRLIENIQSVNYKFIVR
nr:MULTISPECIES: T9SS type A sorting domain-containing protein [unclassified Lentimicrobium]